MSIDLLIANTISPVILGVNRPYLAGLHIALLMSLLAALVEAPFLRRMGVKQYSMVWSIRANMVSCLISIPFILLFIILFMVLVNMSPVPGIVIFLGVLAAGPLFSTVIEYLYLKGRCRTEGAEIRYGLMLLANILSEVLLVGILCCSVYVEYVLEKIGWIDRWHLWFFRQDTFQISLHIAAGVFVIIAAVVWLVPVKRKDNMKEVKSEEAKPVDTGPGLSWIRGERRND